MSDKTAPIKFPVNIVEMIEAWVTADQPSIGWCLLCNRPIKKEAELIPGTNIHGCPEGRSFKETIPPES
jgi:hypothetical protein